MQVTDEMVRVARKAYRACRPVERVACQDFGMQQDDILDQQLEAALTAALAAMWQPIETAPKDGSKVDVWVTPPARSLSTGGYGRVSDCWFSRGSWWFYDETKYASDPANCRSEVWNVTHWMPLPPAPSQLSKRDDAERDSPQEA